MMIKVMELTIIPLLHLHLSAMCWAIFSGVMEYQDSGSSFTPESYRLNNRYLWAQYLEIWGTEDRLSGTGSGACLSILSRDLDFVVLGLA